MSVEIEGSKLENCPLNKDKLVELIETCYEKLKDNFENDKFIQEILSSLNSHSSIYKYIVTITGLDINNLNDNNMNLNIVNSFGASWSPKKDGLYNYVINKENEDSEQQKMSQLLITIIWISK
ncbi:hypothetical protein TPHA_0J00990 [Tetrapisispora phaffii CBS 4417]|uniref:Topoisomerase I damage affected protein 2 n=1 Tax=Tetrapisispora phaffii (strain ATCC 24235 / CBS 4417 / NBRC 1672 / NRRL Y-8282 / UCD 70-5) TaxID=1071381 RepID=G8BYH9_TETPH|nr:hypothetical protein TPHA_0J00990 [Tetrapisispora phaffii CBS 4417]CCE64921.1 hypothetical protein TPHA_0J00990 [Tetrapisispora phaffii CBS 4417]